MSVRKPTSAVLVLSNGQFACGLVGVSLLELLSTAGKHVRSPKIAKGRQVAILEISCKS